MNNNLKPFVWHLEELRFRILYSAAAVIGASSACFFFHKYIFEFLSYPLGNRKLIFIAPQEAFVVSLKVSLLAGIVLSSPFTLYQAWKFVGGALKSSEKNFVFKYVPTALLLFILGVGFGYVIVLPAGLRFLLGFGGNALTPMLAVGKYVSFIFILLLVFGITFQVPLVMRMLTRTGIVERAQLKKTRRYAVVVIFILAALLTPPDIFTQIALAVPVVLLYELGILFSGNKHKNSGLKG